eukprot:6372804-Pyramimonas_sp.AAC.1
MVSETGILRNLRGRMDSDTRIHCNMTECRSLGALVIAHCDGLWFSGRDYGVLCEGLWFRGRE